MKYSSAVCQVGALRSLGVYPKTAYIPILAQVYCASACLTTSQRVMSVHKSQPTMKKATFQFRERTEKILNAVRGLNISPGKYTIVHYIY